MSVILYEGVPGSGKSLHAMSELYWACVRRSTYIMTNFDVKWPWFKRCATYRLPDGALEVEDVAQGLRDWLSSGHRVTREGQVIVVIDEASVSFGNRDWNKPGRTEWLRLFRQHRKYGLRFVLISQSINDIDKAIRGQLAKVGSHTLINNYGLFGDFVSILTLGRPLSMCIYYLPFYGTRRNRAAVVGRELVLGMKRVYRMYDTHELFADDLDLGDVWLE